MRHAPFPTQHPQEDEAHALQQQQGLASASARGGAAGGTAGSEGGTAAASERVAFAPDWLVGSWVTRGALGLWDPSLTAKPKQVRLKMHA